MKAIKIALILLVAGCAKSPDPPAPTPHVQDTVYCTVCVDKFKTNDLSYCSGDSNDINLLIPMFENMVYEGQLRYNCIRSWR